MTHESLVKQLEEAIINIDEQEASNLMVEWICMEMELGDRYDNIKVEINQDMFGKYHVDFSTSSMSETRIRDNANELAQWLSEVVA